MFDLAQAALLIGAVNGFILLVKPIARLHVRIDRNEQAINHIQQDLARLFAELDDHDHN